MEGMDMVGRRFKPTDDFLIRVLVRLAAGLCVNLSPHMVELDLYGPGKEPWKLFSSCQEIWELYNVADPERKVREKFIITKVSRIGGKTNISRTAGLGTWLDKSRAKDVKVGDWVVGHQKTLTYEYCGGDGAAADKSYYYLHEFELSSEALQDSIMLFVGYSRTSQNLVGSARSESLSLTISMIALLLPSEVVELSHKLWN